MRLDRLTMPPTRSFLPTYEQPFKTSIMPNSANLPYYIGVNNNDPGRVQFRTPPPQPTVTWNLNVCTSPLEAIGSPLPRTQDKSTISCTMPSERHQSPYRGTEIDAKLPPFLTPLPIPLLPVSSHSHTPPPTPPAATDALPQIQSHFPLYLSNLLPTQSLLHKNQTADLRNVLPRFPPLILGNLLLSSCPGKKVRLKGPVKGRGAICRDLGTDLERVAGMGVRCIVW